MAICAEHGCPEYVPRGYCSKHVRRGRQFRSPTTRAQDADYYRKRKIVLAGSPRCRWCGAPATTVDHVLAVANGGTNSLVNLVPACSPCNLSRQANPNWVPPRLRT